jgi:hypothetical protein
VHVAEVQPCRLETHLFASTLHYRERGS